MESSIPQLASLGEILFLLSLLLWLLLLLLLLSWLPLFLYVGLQVDPPRTPTIDKLAASIASKWQPNSSSSSPSSTSTSVFLSIAGYRLNPDDPVDLLRDDDVVDVTVASSYKSQHRRQNSSQQINQRDYQHDYHQNHNRRAQYQKRLSIHHADRSGFGLDVDAEGSGSVVSNYAGSNTNAAVADSATFSSGSKWNEKPVTVEGAGEEVDAKAKKHRSRRIKRGASGLEINAAEVALSTSAEAAALNVTPNAAEATATPATEGKDDDDNSPAKKKRKRRPKKAKGFDLTLPHGGMSQWETVPSQLAATSHVRVPFKIGHGLGASSAGRSRIVFDEEGAADSAAGNVMAEMQEVDDVEEEEAAAGDKDLTEEEATEEEEEEEETEESKKEKAIGDEDVNAWDPISQLPKEGDIVAFKVKI